MKVRIGFGPGRIWGMEPERLVTLIDDLERYGFDSLWLTEYIGHKTPDPMVGLAVAAGRARQLGLGTSIMVLPGRNPAVVAKQVATLDRLSGGRMLPTFGLGIADAHEQQASGVHRSERAAWFDEALPLVRRFWMEDEVSHDGPRFHYSRVRVLPKPLQQPLEVWAGGRAASELRRAGRLADGWLADPFSTREEAEAGWQVVNDAAVQAERSIDPNHFGAVVMYAPGPLNDAMAKMVRSRRGDVDPASLIAAGMDALANRLKEFIAAGASRLVVVPIQEPQLDVLAASVLPLQT